MPRPNTDQLRCLRRIAPRVRGMDFPEDGPVPIPETFHPMAAVEMGNGALFLRCCRERGGLSRADAEHSLKMLWTQAALAGRQDAPDMLLALLKQYPEALEQKEGAGSI